jgi:hypothetical protein
MKNTIVLGLLSTVALFAIGAIGNIAMPVFADDDDDDDEYVKATLYCKITHFDKDDYYDTMIITMMITTTLKNLMH